MKKEKKTEAVKAATKKSAVKVSAAKVSVKKAGASQQHKTKITNIYKGISTEERIKLYLRLCDYVMQGENVE